MSPRADRLLKEALTLPATERADVAAELLASLDATSDGSAEAVKNAWAEETERRARRVLNGDSAGESWEIVRHRISG